MVIIIHGFGSAGRGGKAMLFREYFKKQNISCIAPSLSYVPELAIDTLEQLIELCDEEITLIGSSLGGYYAIYLAEKYRLKAILINPAIYSSQTLKKAINMSGLAPNYYDNSKFGWTQKHVDMLEKYSIDRVQNGKYLLFLQKGDDILDYRDAINRLPNAKMVIEDGGTHPFEGIERFLPLIKEFIETKTAPML